MTSRFDPRNPPSPPEWGGPPAPPIGGAGGLLIFFYFWGVLIENKVPNLVLILTIQLENFIFDLLSQTTCDNSV
jgi:hypothetical protein